jgi:phosphoribosylformylglycinamidine synthase subunit PurQ / glutaminase
VITFPWSLEDKDAARAIQLAGSKSVALRHADADLHAVDAIVLPSGCSCGDYLRCGEIAKFAPAYGETGGRRDGRYATQDLVVKCAHLSVNQG